MAEAKTTAKKNLELVKPVEQVAGEKKPPVKKATAAKPKAAEPKTTITVQYAGQDITTKSLIAQIKKDFKKANKGVEIKKIDLYIKPEEAAVYYAVNGKGSEDYKIMF